MYLFKISIVKPLDPVEYFINWNNGLDIGDCDMQMLNQDPRKRGSLKKLAPNGKKDSKSAVA